MPSTIADRPRFPVAARLAVAVLAVAVGLPGAGRAEAPLRWKFKAGESVLYNVVQKTDTTMKAGGRTGGSKVTQTSDIRWKVESVSPEGVAELTQTIDRVRVRMESVTGQPPFEFDSASEEPAAEGAVATELAPVFKALAGLKCTMMIDARGEIREVRIADSVVQSLEKSFRGGLGHLFSKESLKNMIGQSSMVLPEKAVDKGESWTEKTETAAPNLGTMIVERTYTFLGPEAEDPSHVRINLKTNTALKPTPDSQVDFEMKKQDGKGVFVFDAAKGRIVSSRIDVEMAQSMKFKGQEVEQSSVNSLEMTLAPETPPR